MVKAWLMSSDDSTVQVRKVDMADVLQTVTLTGVELWKIDDPEDSRRLEEFTQRFDIKLTGSVDTNVPLGDLSQEEYEAELARYVRPHFHFTDEMRRIQDGSCYIDIQVADKKWARLHLTGGDGIMIPAGVFHSVSLDENKLVKACGYFRSRGLGDEYIPRYGYDVRILISHNERRQSQSVATCT